MVLVHHQRNVGIGFGSGLDQVLDEVLACVLACAGAGLQDHRGTHFVGSRHHGLHLLQVVDVKGRNTIAIFGSMVQQFAHRYECHGMSP